MMQKFRVSSIPMKTALWGGTVKGSTARARKSGKSWLEIDGSESSDRSRRRSVRLPQKRDHRFVRPKEDSLDACGGISLPSHNAMPKLIITTESQGRIGYEFTEDLITIG